MVVFYFTCVRVKAELDRTAVDLTSTEELV